MNFFAPVGIVIIVALILTFLQLVPGVFVLFCHYASGKFNAKKAGLLKIFFILGTETVAACLLIATILLANAFFWFTARPEASFLGWILAGIMLALAIVSLTSYYRGGAGTRLFIPRRSAAALNHYARIADTRSDAFILGALAGILELPFTLPLYLIASLAIVQLSVSYLPLQLLILLPLLAPTIPLFNTRLRFHTGYNLADLQKSRVASKNFTRLLLCFSYATLGVLCMYLGGI